jgi:anti-sigma regulatory factor (Ser/Thr protein kinase)
MAWGLDEDEIYGPLLVANELVTNAVEHAGTTLELAVQFDGAVVTIGLRDHSPAAPRIRPFDPLAARGRGLQIVAELSCCWSWTEHPDGKTVWAEVVPSWPAPESCRLRVG